MRSRRSESPKTANASATPQNPSPPREQATSGPKRETYGSHTARQTTGGPTTSRPPKPAPAPEEHHSSKLSPPNSTARSSQTPTRSWRACQPNASRFTPQKRRRRPGLAARQLKPPADCGNPLFAGAASDNNTSIFQSEAALTTGSEEATGRPTRRTRKSQRPRPAMRLRVQPLRDERRHPPRRQRHQRKTRARCHIRRLRQREQRTA